MNVAFHVLKITIGDTCRSINVRRSPYHGDYQDSAPVGLSNIRHCPDSVNLHWPSAKLPRFCVKETLYSHYRVRTPTMVLRHDDW